MRWNFTSQAAELCGADVLLLSVPKSGCHSLRTFLDAYYTLKTGWPFIGDITQRGVPGVPRIVYSHDRFQQRTRATLRDRMLGTYLVPGELTRRAPIVLLVRNPRDVFRAYAAELKGKDPAVPQHIGRMSSDALMRHPRYGISAIVEVMNAWLNEFGHREDFNIMRYEDFVCDPATSFRDLLEVIGETKSSLAAFCEALSFWEVMGAPKQRDENGQADSESLHPANKGNGCPSPLPEDDDYLTAACARLDPQFGYIARPEKAGSTPENALISSAA